MKKLLPYFFIIIVTTPLFSQEKQAIPDIEKTYIHTDRTRYVAGESLWYKAYNVYAYNNFLFDHSNILYVELINSNSRIISRNKTKLIGGLGHGDFKLTDSAGVKPGNYQIRAYTNWNRNFGKDFVFKKNIEVIDVFNDVTTKTQPINANSEINKSNSSATQIQDIKFQFFPEGGSLIQNTNNIIAFKAVDRYGNPISVQGKVFDSNNELVTFFKSAHDGMGKFPLMPISGKSYHAKITDANQTEIEAALPNALENGFILSYNEIKGRAIITISTNEKTLSAHSEKPLTIQYKSRGLLYFEESLPLSSNKLMLELPKAELPEGITQITLLDSDLKPQCERLVYVDKPQDVTIALSTNKTIYKPNEKVSINVASINNLEQAVPASYSIAAVDLNGSTDLNSNETNISSYFLMESDIRGKVHNPGYYFDSSNPARFQHLDLLLLTQGWRGFLWKKDFKIDKTPLYKAEKGIEITGKVKRLFGSKPIEGNKVSLVVKGKTTGGIITTTNALGEFKFDDLNLIDNANITLTTKNKNGKASGMFVLDSIFRSPMPVDPFSKTKRTTTLSPEITKTIQNIYKKHIEFDVLPENVLDEIEVTGQRLDASKDTNINSKVFQGYVVDENSPQFATVFELLEYAIPTLDVGNRETIKFSRNPGAALILIDQNRKLDPVAEGSDMIISMLTDIQPDEVIKIEYDNSAVSTMMYGNPGRNGSIKIYTTQNSNSNFGNSSPKDALQSVKQQVIGYYEGRMFYTPDLENTEESKDKNASIRNTLYWNPYIHPNETGVSEVNYYNTQVETKVKITLEGITATGIPVVKKTTYRIEK